MKFSSWSVISLLLLTFSAAGAQLPAYLIYCDQDEFDDMQQNWSEEIEIDCTVILGDSVFTGSRIRLRGDSSRGYPKKSYRITTSALSPLEGRTEWNFNSEYEDGTYMHSWLFARIMEELDYPCFSIDHAMFYVNDIYMGLYVRAEPVDEQFLLENGLDPQGNLYKAAVDGACLSRWDDVEAFWSKKTNESEGWNDLYELIDFLDTVDSDRMHLDAGEYLDINSLLTIIAVNTLTSNYSTYYHNYYMYRDIRGTGLWKMLPWDVDKTFGDWITRAYTAGVNAFWYDNALFENVLLDPVLLDLYFERMEEISSQVFNSNFLGPYIDSLETVLTDAVEADLLDNVTPEEFHESVSVLRDVRIPDKIVSLRQQYDDDVRPFRAWQMDDTSLGDHHIWWESAEVASGGSVTYSVHITTKLGHPDSTFFQVFGLVDTCFTFTGLPDGNFIWWVEAAGENHRRTEAYDHWNPLTVDGTFGMLSGTISGTTVLTLSGSPYLVTSDLTVPDGSQLLVEEGVQIRLLEGVDILCRGTLRIDGAEGAPVLVTADDPSMPWGGLRVTGSAHISHAEFRASSGYEPSGTEGACLEGRYAAITLENCSFTANARCINLLEGSIVMDSCEVTGWNTGELFFMEDGESALITGSEFGNMVDPPASWHDGIEFQNCRGGSFIVSDCRIFNIEGDGVDLNGSDVTLEDVFISSIEDKGVSVGINTSAGSATSSIEISGSLVTDCYEGVSVKDGSHAGIEGSTVTGCATGLRAYEKTFGYGGGHFTVEGTIVCENEEDISIENGSDISITYSLTGGTSPMPGTGNIAGDPQFDSWGGDLRILSATSPCIDAGDPAKTDPDRTRSDIGSGFFPQNLEGLRLNEIQSVNDITIADGYGQFDDWLEIYNGTGFDCDLGWIHLSDDPDILSGYRFPAGTEVPAGGFLLVWMDGEWWQDGLHVPWRLSSQNDSLYISSEIPESTGSGGLHLLDSLRFGRVGTDRSYGRIPDGSGQWELMEIPTPGTSNSGGSPSGGYLHVSYPFPNPVRQGYAAIDVTVDGGLTEVLVYDLAGRLVMEIGNGYLTPGEHRIYWNTTGANEVPVPNGVYLIQVLHAGGLSESRKVIVISN